MVGDIAIVTPVSSDCQSLSRLVVENRTAMQPVASRLVWTFE